MILAVCALCVVFTLFCFSRLPGAMDPQGGETASCVNEDIRPVSNDAGMIAAAHVTSCDNFVHDRATYVYVHRSGTNDSRKSLVFRFGNADDTDSPAMTWIDKSTLHISIGHVSEVSKQISHIDGVEITYSIGKEDFPREDSARAGREVKHLAEGMSVVLLLLIWVCVILVRSIVRERMAGDPAKGGPIAEI